MKTGSKIFAAFLLTMGMNGLASATSIISGDGSETCTYGTPISSLAGNCAVQTINTDFRWQTDNPNNNGALWISYADTGSNGTTLAPTAAVPIFTVTETFSTHIGDVLNLDVWADDTAEVFINGDSLFPPNFSQSVCANGAIGCEPGENGKISYTFFTEGVQTLTFDVFQIGTGTSNYSNPFGLLYSGTVNAAVPEPSAIVLMLTGLLGMGFAGLRKIQA